jgi:dienelactone hydrolase
MIYLAETIGSSGRRENYSVTEDVPHLSLRPARKAVKAVVLVLHGGAERGTGRVRPWRLSYLRMVPIARAISRAGAEHGVEVRLLRNRVYGWNAPNLDPVQDARWALAQIHLDHPGVPVILVGHSLGGRVALRVADDPSVIGVCALAPWTPEDEPVRSVAGKSVLIVHGVQDRVTDPAGSYSFARRAEPEALRVARFELDREGHAMLRRFTWWNRLIRGFILDVVSARSSRQAWREIVETAWTKPTPPRWRIPL